MQPHILQGSTKVIIIIIIIIITIIIKIIICEVYMK